jgi:hypothetical protein
MHDMATDANGVYSNLPDFAGIYCIKPRVESRWDELNRVCSKSIHTLTSKGEWRTHKHGFSSYKWGMFYKDILPV